MEIEQESNLSTSESQASNVKQGDVPAEKPIEQVESTSNPEGASGDVSETKNDTDQSTHKEEIKSGASESSSQSQKASPLVPSSRRPFTFSEACLRIRRLPKNPSDYDVLEAHALYKQATEGDNVTPIPNELDFVGLAKWDAWKNKRGLSSEEAQACYIDLVYRLESNN